jgi:hypothetical protein
MVIDADTCVCLIVEQDLVDEENDDEDSSTFRDMCDQLIRLSMSFQTMWVIFDCKVRKPSSVPESVGDKMPGSVASSDIQTFIKFQKWFVQMQASLDCSLKLRYTCSTLPSGLDDFALLLNEFVETTASTKRKQSENHFEDWLNRDDFLGEIESDKERFLSLAVPGMNCFKAQQLLGSVSLLDCLGWYRESTESICARHPECDPYVIEIVRFALSPQ